MALTNNPNRTKTIERKWRREINQRWRRLWKEVKNLPLNSIVVNLAPQEQQEANQFLLGFEELIAAIILADSWQNKYQATAYDQAVERTSSQLTSIAPSVMDDVLIAAGIAGLVLSPIHQNEKQFLFTRANDKLQGWMQTLVGETRQILQDNYGKLSNTSILTLIKERINSAKGRAKSISTTEVSQASQRAVVKQSELLAETTGEEVIVRWITVNDSKVRHLHAGWHGRTFTQEEALANMKISPWNCRCGLRPVIPKRDPARLRARFAKERKHLLASEKNTVA